MARAASVCVALPPQPTPAELKVSVRLLLSIVTLVLIAIAFVILFEYPQYSDYAFYLLIVWIVVYLALLYTLRRFRVPSVAANVSVGSSPLPPSMPALPPP